MAGPLGRRAPTDWEHVDRYPLTAPILEALPPSPVAAGTNWYPFMDEPVQDSAGRWWLRPPANWGSPRGGHAFAFKQRGARDLIGWWEYYDQGSEGRCVQFGISRVMTLLNRRRYEVRENWPSGRWLYWEAQRTDEWDGGAYPDASPFYEGTSVRAGLNVVRRHGIVPYRQTTPILLDGISEFRWIRSIDDLLTVLGYQDVGYCDLLNSWGRNGYPHLVRVPVEVVERLWREDGELGVVTDRA